MPCDVLVPAALENQITAENAAASRPRSWPKRPTARPRRKPTRRYSSAGSSCPGHPRNAGGVTVSYFEWVQDLNRDHWSEDQVNHRLKEIMTKAFAETLALAELHEVNMRTGAYMLAVDRVAQATALRGLYP